MLDLETLATELLPHGVHKPHDCDWYLQPEQTIVAVTLWGEARGEGWLGIYLVGCVIRNRVEASPKYGVKWRGVCLKPFQFSCFLDPGLRRALDKALEHPASPDALVWETCCSVARAVTELATTDPTQGAQFYFTDGIKPPTWSKVMTQTFAFGHHKFFRES